MTVNPPAPFPLPLRPVAGVCFDRGELRAILGVYGRMVAAGEWRDYAIASRGEAAIFAAFRRTAEQPFCRIEKHPRLRSRQGQYSVVGADGRVLRRGHDLALVLRVIERRLIRAVEA